MDSVQKIFYSWQSDLDKDLNMNCIRHALRDMSSNIENEIGDLKIVVDEATRNMPGSPNIPRTIFEKISTSDIFICDLSTINNSAPSEFRRVANPNVLIELGYAIASLGWARIILLSNTFFGKFPDDLPFDIDRHRATKFRVESKQDKNGKKQLTDVLTEAVKLIIEHNPLRPEDEKQQTPEQKKRIKDINNLRSIMSLINIPRFDYFLEEMPNRIVRDVLTYQECFLSIVDSSSFYIYDQELSKLINKFKDNWIASVADHQYYEVDESGKGYRFKHLVMDQFTTEKSEKDFYKIAKITSELRVDFNNLIRYIRNNYLEIDLEETSEVALKFYNQHSFN